MSPAYSNYSNESVADVPIAGLRRGVAGLIFQDNFDRALGAPGANWEIISGVWAIANTDLAGIGTVLKASPAATAVIRVAPAVFGAARAELVIQCQMRRQGTGTVGGDTAGDDVFPSIQHRIDANNNYQTAESNSGINTAIQLYKVVAGVATLLAEYVSGNLGPLGMISHKISRKTAYQKSWSFHASEIILTAADVALIAGAESALGVSWTAGSTSWAEFNNFSAYKNNRVKLSSMPTGHKLRLKSWNSLSGVQEDLVAVEAGGIAEVELEHRRCPLLKDNTLALSDVELLRADNTVLTSLPLADGVWGGDEYLYSL